MKEIFHVDNAFFKNPFSLGEINLIQLGRLYLNAGETVDKHFHDNIYEFTVITDGKGEILTENEKVSVSSGDVHLCFDGVYHTIISDKLEPLKYDYFAFNFNDGDFKNEFISAKNSLNNLSVVFKNETVKNLIFNMISEIVNGKEYSKEILTISAKQILLLSLREMKGANKEKSGLYPQKAQLLCYQIMNYIDTHLTSINSLKELADEFSYNYSYLSDVFKTTTGRSIKNYFSSAKLKLAKNLLEKEDLTITEIAERVNFSSIYTFSRAFKNMFGYSPEKVKKDKNNT